MQKYPFFIPASLPHPAVLVGFYYAEDIAELPSSSPNQADVPLSLPSSIFSGHDHVPQLSAHPYPSVGLLLA